MKVATGKPKITRKMDVKTSCECTCK